MTPSPPTPGQSGQRTLAAILFTDVVGFSARMQKDEATTLELLQKDFDAMRRVCEAHQGSVLKSTGDGLLMTFSSAVHAVACSLAMQRQFAAVESVPGAPEPLLHRIGIHLGDVLIQGQDVMGDGVNIAARLQAEAEPGGICISQTVYDVVKNKLELHVLSLGARDLKNISETIPVYRLMMGPGSAAALRSDGRAVSSRRGLIGSLVVVVVVVAGLGGWLWYQRSQEPAPAGGGAVLATPPPAGEPLPVPPTPVPVQAAALAELEADIEERLDLMEHVRAQYLNAYDFQGLARAVREKSEPAAARIAQLPKVARTIDQMEGMMEWLLVTLRKYSRQRPLAVPDGSKDPTREMKVFLSPDKRFVFLEHGESKPRLLADLKPEELGAIVVAAIWQTKPPASREVFSGAVAFSKLYSLPKMQEALFRIRPRAGSK